MKNMLHTIQIVFTAIGGYLGWLMGGFDGFMYALLAFVAIDYITGLMVAVLEKKLSSEVGFRGIFKKILIFIMVGIGNIIDTYLIKDGSAIRTATIFFYIANESISIFENTGKIGLPIPEKLKKALEQLNKEDKSNE